MQKPLCILQNKRNTKRRIHVFILVPLFIIGLILLYNFALASGNFVRIKLPKELELDFPQNWIVLSNNQRITLDASAESRLDLADKTNPESKLPFAANYYNDSGTTVGMANVRYYPEIELTQNDAILATEQDVYELDAMLKADFLQSTNALDIPVLAWNGTKKISTNGLTAFISEYRRKSKMGSGVFRVRLVRVFAAERSFTLTVSYLESESNYLEPITDRIIRSIKFSGNSNPQQIQKISSAPGIWSNLSEGFGAMFPTTPEKVSAEARQGAGYAYQSVKRFDSGAALYAITIFPIPPTIKKNSFKIFLELSNEAFVKSMGQDSSRAKINWDSFGDRRNRLDYDFRFTYDEIPFRARGFWIIDRGRTIRVSISYTESLTPNELDEALSFLDSFVILSSNQQ